MVVNNIEDMAPLYEAQKEIYGKNASSYYYSLYIGIDGNREEKLPVEMQCLQQLVHPAWKKGTTVNIIS